MLTYRNILLVVTILSFAFAGLSEIRNSLALTLVLLNLSLWSLPIYAKWKKGREAGTVKAETQLRVGNYVEAEQMLILVLAETERQHTSVTKRARILENLAEAQRKQGKFAAAEQSIRQAIALVTDPKGQLDRVEFGRCLEGLACIYQDSGNHPQERQVLQEALGLEEGLPKPNLERLAKLQRKLALSYHHASDYSSAAPHFARALELHERAFGAEHAETGKMLTEIGTAQLKEGKQAEAIGKLERALAIQEKILGADSLEVTESLYQLALACERSGDPVRAAAHFERILLLRERQVGGNESELAEVYLGLSRVCLALGRLARAGEAAQSAILIFERKPGSELASALETFGAICESASNREEAAAAYERAKEVRKAAGSSRREASA